MDIEGEDGTKLLLNAGVKSEFGRGAGFNTEDLTVSRRHVSLEFKPAAAGTEQSESDSVSFKVLGRNPVWLRSGKPGEKIRTFRKPETGEIVAGDRFCVSGNLPIWFTLKRRDEVMEERALDGERELDISDIDPVKEFGFLVIGKEFDQYPKSRMRDTKQWEWFLEDFTNGNSDDDDEDEDGDKKRRNGLSKKRRRKKGNEDDDDWSVESEEDKELVVKSKRVVNPTYSTRCKKTKKDTNATSSSSGGAQNKQRGSGRVDVEEDDDETLGGFIVSDEEAKLEEDDESNVDEEEEEEEEDDDFDEE
ncbi:hypothetical protein V5N11_028250 [Cardamine amara subsp. amara]|uniref:SMAD/FHA domain-containing protein n=1 Tax=Cardamine amara subsp. amara TaxID=228776 RepID=A0ABD1BH26_CARAN